MVFQSYALYPHMSVREATSPFPCKMGASAEGRASTRRSRRAAKVLNLTDYLDRKPRQLSGGQRQRVAIGRAIVREPKAFLFDEPLSNLDAALRVDMRLEISELHNKLKTTMVYVTHDQVEAMTMADKIVVLNAGRIEQVGSPAGALHAPSQQVRCRVHRQPQDELHRPVPSPPSTAHQTIGVRPEHIDISATEAGLERHASASAEHLGVRHVLHVDGTDLADTLTVRADRRYELSGVATRSG